MKGLLLIELCALVFFLGPVSFGGVCTLSLYNSLAGPHTRSLDVSERI